MERKQGERGVGYAEFLCRYERLRNLHALFVVLLVLKVLRRESLHNPLAGQIFLQHGVQFSHHILDLEPRLPQLEAYDARNQYHRRHKAYGGKPQLPVHTHKYHRNHHDEQREIRRADDAHIHEHSDVFHIRNRAGHQVAGVVLVVKAETQMLHMVIDAVAYVI